MSIGASIALFAVGAIMRFAVTVTVAGFNLQDIGVILMIAGALGLVLSLTVRGGGGGGVYRRRRSVTRDATGGYVEAERGDVAP